MKKSNKQKKNKEKQTSTLRQNIPDTTDKETVICLRIIFLFPNTISQDFMFEIFWLC